MIDLNYKYYYLVDTPELKTRTVERLVQLNELGLTDLGEAQFGIKGIMSGLYIERVWSYSKEEWDKYIDWIKSLINKNTEIDPVIISEQVKDLSISISGKKDY